jgi:hypothetical protein
MTSKADRIELKLLTIDLAPMILGCLQAFPKQSCDLNLCNIFTWGQIYKLHYFIWKGAYVLYNPRYHYLAYPFCNRMSPAELADLVQRFRSIDPRTEMILFPQDWLKENKDAENYFSFRILPDWSDYVYRSDDLFNLSGKKLAKKKNLISQFLRQHPVYDVQPIIRSDMDAILDHFKQWQTGRNARSIGLTIEYRAVKNSFLFWDKLPNAGLKIILDGEIIAWSIFSPQTENMATIHFEKFDPNLKGCAQLINWETARYLHKSYRYINREQDMGIEGLRQAKRSYEPEFMVPFITSRLK